MCKIDKFSSIHWLFFPSRSLACCWSHARLKRTSMEFHEILGVDGNRIATTIQKLSQLKLNHWNDDAKREKNVWSIEKSQLARGSRCFSVSIDKKNSLRWNLFWEFKNVKFQDEYTVVRIQFREIIDNYDKIKNVNHLQRKFQINLVL